MQKDIIVGDGGMKPKGGRLFGWLHHFWHNSHHVPKLIFVGVAAVLIVGGTALGLYMMYNSAQKQKIEEVTQQQIAKSKEEDSPKTSADTPTTQTPDTTKKDEPAKTDTKTDSGGGGSSGGSSGGTSGGGTSTGSCPLPAYPNASCTGVPAGTTLTVVNGDMTISANNTVIEGKDIRGCVDVNASGVIIRKSKISADCFYVIYRHSSSGTPLLIEDSEISCLDHNGTGIGDTGITVKRSNIHGCENGFDLDGDVTIQDSYIHDLTQTGADPHTDGIQITPVGHNITIQHNTIYAFTNGVNGTSAIIEANANLTNIVIKENLVAGGAYTIYCKSSGAYANSWSMTNNHFSTINGPNVGEYGPMTDCQDEPNVSGNVYHESGQPVPLQ